jgi:glycosyltransferase involved in cell wall biosynthesis
LAKALIVSSFFPPHNSAGGSIRLVKFIKHLSDWGWEFVVITQDSPAIAAENRALSSFLLDELPKGIVIRRIAQLFSFGHRSSAVRAGTGIVRRVFGESSLGWGLNAFWKGLADLRKSKIDLIFSVTPPFTNALTALLLAYAGRKPLILDLKDDWVDSPPFRQKNIVRQGIEKWLETLIVRRASAVITVTPQSFRLYKERYAYLRKPEKFHLIPNGCDLDEYHRLAIRERKIASDRFTILSAAWGFRKEYRDITPFFLAVDLFFKRRPDAKGNSEVILLGDSLSSEYDELVSELDLNAVVRCVGAVKREALVEQLWKADLFLLVQPVNNTTAISGTLYEYWATGKAPILLISEKGASSALVEDNRLGTHYYFNQVQDIADYIEGIFNAYQSGHPIWIEREGVENFDRRMLAKRMDDIWSKVIAES